MRRDIWLHAHKNGWLVRARAGDDCAAREWRYTDDAQARVWVGRLIDRGGGGWSDVTDVCLRDRLRS